MDDYILEAGRKGLDALARGEEIKMPIDIQVINYAAWVGQNLNTQEFVALILGVDPSFAKRKPYNQEFYLSTNEALLNKKFEEFYSRMDQWRIGSGLYAYGSIFEWLEYSLKNNYPNPESFPKDLLNAVKFRLEQEQEHLLALNKTDIVTYYKCPLLIKKLGINIQKTASEANDFKNNLGDKERDNLLATIGALTSILAESASKYKYGDKINQKAIADKIELLFANSEGETLSGFKQSALRDRISKGLKSFEEKFLKD